MDGENDTLHESGKNDKRGIKTYVINLSDQFTVNYSVYNEYSYLSNYIIFWQGDENDDDNYDSINYSITGDNIANVYGDIGEDPEFQIMHNPYYGDDEIITSEFSSNRRGKSDPYTTEAITAQTNIYYE